MKFHHFLRCPYHKIPDMGHRLSSCRLYPCKVPKLQNFAQHQWICSKSRCLPDCANLLLSKTFHCIKCCHLISRFLIGGIKRHRLSQKRWNTNTVNFAYCLCKRKGKKHRNLLWKKYSGPVQKGGPFYFRNRKKMLFYRSGWRRQWLPHKGCPSHRDIRRRWHYCGLRHRFRQQKATDCHFAQSG